MDERLVNLILGSLLHDVGKIVHRTGVMKSHSNSGWEFLSELAPFKDKKDIKECIKYHHGRELSSAKIAEDSLAYITYIADNISAAGDRRLDAIEGEEAVDKANALFDRSAPLQSVFNILNGNQEKYTYPFKRIDKINYPSKEKITYTTGNYEEILLTLKEQLEAIDMNENYIDSVLHLLEATTTLVPSSTNTKELMDISLYDHSKITAAIASCLYYYLAGEKDYKRLLNQEKEFKKENAYLLYSCDISGIQNFIYTISGTSALKSLRIRSLYLELLLENIIDHILSQLKLSRCNLIYTGGGHAYLLLPNTKKSLEILEKLEIELKEWFIDTFGISLYIAGAYAECNSVELAEDIGQVYKRVGEAISIKKSKRYTAQDILKLNTTKRQKEDRECIECKRTGPVSVDKKCHICQSLIDMSPQVIKANSYFAIEEDTLSMETALPLPFNQVLKIKKAEEIRGSEYIRVYSKNNPSVGEKYATNLWVGDYSIINEKENRVKTFEELAEEAAGIDRIAILRADVDNLGKAFMFGFKEQKNGQVIENSERKYETISRTSTLSRQLSMFFKFHINQIMANRQRNSHIIYSGGDDMFIVGSWNDVIDLSKDIQAAFDKYSQGTLTISAGIGIYGHSYPISRIASEVGDLESAAKTKDQNKNKVTLFRDQKLDDKGKVIEADWILEWPQLPYVGKNNIVKHDELIGIVEKLYTLRNTMKTDSGQGKNLLYNILLLMRESGQDKINIARYAYLLKRAEERNPKIDIPKFYSYIKDEKQKREFEIAITLYAYETRN